MTISKYREDRPLDRQAMAQEYFFDGHACTTGDCPHEKTSECLEDAYLAGLADGCNRNGSAFESQPDATREPDERVRKLVEGVRGVVVNHFHDVTCNTKAGKTCDCWMNDINSALQQFEASDGRT